MEINDNVDYDKKYGYCEYRDKDGYCRFDKSEEEINNDDIWLCENISNKKKMCNIY